MMTRLLHLVILSSTMLLPSIVFSQDSHNSYILLDPNNRLEPLTPPKEDRYRLLDPTQSLNSRDQRSQYWLLDEKDMRYFQEHVELFKSYEARNIAQSEERPSS